MRSVTYKLPKVYKMIRTSLVVTSALLLWINFVQIDGAPQFGGGGFSQAQASAGSFGRPGFGQGGFGQGGFGRPGFGGGFGPYRPGFGGSGFSNGGPSISISKSISIGGGGGGASSANSVARGK